MSSVTERPGPLDGRDVTPMTPASPTAPTAPKAATGWRPAVPWRRPARLGGPRRRHRVGDPLLVGLVALAVYALHGYDGVLDRDLGMFVYGGEHVARGTPPYVGIFNSVGPLADAVPGLAIWLGHQVGADPILSARLLFTVISAGCCSLLCVLARDTLRSRVAGLIAPALFLTFQCFLNLASNGPREKTTMVLFVLACLVLLGRRRWFGAGMCAALATLTWQPALGAAVGALVAAALLEQHGARLRAVVRFAVGGAVPSLVTVVYFLAEGAISRAWEGFVVINVRDTQQPSAFTDPQATATMLWESYHVTLLLAVVGLVGVVVLGVRAVTPARHPTASPVARRLVMVGAGAVAATVWTLLAINGAPDLFVLLPFAALGATGLVTLGLSHLSPRRALVGAVAVVSLGVVMAATESVTTRDDRLLAQRDDIAAVLGSLPPSPPGTPRVVTLNAPQVLAITGGTSPTPYQYFSGSADRYLDVSYPGGMRAFLSNLEELHPTVVAVGSSFRGLWPYGWLTRDYVRIGQGVGVSWYISRAVGASAIAAARLAHHQALFPYRG